MVLKKSRDYFYDFQKLHHVAIFRVKMWQKLSGNARKKMAFHVITD